MNRGILITALILATGTLLVGCNKSHKEGDARAYSEAGLASTERHAEFSGGISFSEKSGLKVSQATAKFIGLQIAEVEERKVAAEFRFAARVYRAAREARFVSTVPMNPLSALASGRISRAEGALLREGQPVSVCAEGLGPLPARVFALERGWEKSSGEMEVLLSITDKNGQLASGTFVSAAVTIGGEQSVVSVPKSALLRTTEGDFVYTVSGESFVRAAVKLGAVNGEFAEVTDGLYAGDQVVVQPTMTLWLSEIQALRGGKSCAHGH